MAKEKMHWMDDAATARANNNEIVIAWCGEGEIPGCTILEAVTNLERVTCPTCKRLMRRVGLFG